MKSGFRTDRPTFVTGATGLVGGWLVKRLLASGAHIVCLVRDSVPQSESVRAGLAQRARTVQGSVCDQVVIERTLGEYEVDTVIHRAVQTIVCFAKGSSRNKWTTFSSEPLGEDRKQWVSCFVTSPNRSPVSTFESNIGGTWPILEAYRRSPGSSADRSSRGAPGSS